VSRQRLLVGAAGEEAARAYLIEQGYTIERYNYRCPLGEIDIIAREERKLVFFEVRAGTGSDLKNAAESITAVKIRKLKKLALYYLQSVYGRDIPCRFDFLAVLLERDTLKTRQIEHIRDIVPG
jgi:putative endonuclease